MTSSWTASTSEVMREMARPEVYWSWKPTDRRWNCWYNRRRSVSRRPLPARPEPRMNQTRPITCTTTATDIATSSQVSVRPSPAASRGMPTSRTCCTRYGIASAAPDAAITATTSPSPTHL